MKKIIFIIALLISANFVCAQIVDTTYNSSVVREGNTFTKQHKDKTPAVTEIETEYKYKDAKGKQHNIWITSRGNAFIWRTSNKTNRQYKYYLGEDISKEICKELNIEYKPKKKS